MKRNQPKNYIQLSKYEKTTLCAYGGERKGNVCIISKLFKNATLNF